MNRRSLVVGAAALATIAGTRIPAAHASGDTIAHARSVLGLVNPDLGLVDPGTALTRIEAAFTAYEASPPRDPHANDLHAWTQQRAADLARSGFPENVLDNPLTRNLLGFAFLLYSQQQERHAIPAITRGMPVPDGLATLESDFFPELNRQIVIRTRSSPAFADALRSGAAELDRAMAQAARGAGSAAQKKPSFRDQYWAVVLILSVACVLITGGELIKRIF